MAKIKCAWARYKVMLVNRGKTIKTLYRSASRIKAEQKFKEYAEASDNVVYPVKVNVVVHERKDAEYELILMKQRGDEDPESNSFQNDFGKYVEYKTSNDIWLIIDRIPYNKEEEFWVYGYHPYVQRKTFPWIFENIIASGGDSKDTFKTIEIYNNKVLIDTNGKLDMVICKTHSEAIRMYNLIQEWSNERKYKYIAFMGVLTNKQQVSEVISRIQEITGWKRNKITRLTTRD